jgi:chromosome partitioning protein
LARAFKEDGAAAAYIRSRSAPSTEREGTVVRIIAVAMTKGGVGKTTTAVSLSHGLALHGQRVLLVDADTQGQCAKALGVRPELTLAGVLSGEITAPEAVTKARENLDLLASDYHLSGPALAIARRETDGHTVLARALAPLAHRYDFVVIDAAPGFDSIAVNVLSCAESVVAPVALTPAAMVGILDFVRHVGQIRRHNRRLCLRYVLPTFLDARIQQPAEMLKQLRDHFGRVLCDPIRVNVPLAEAFGWHQTIFEYAPRSRGAEDYTKFSERVLRDAQKDADREKLSPDDVVDRALASFLAAESREPAGNGT